MEITYIGQSCFKLKGKELEIVIDPYNPSELGYKLPKLSADIVISSHDHFDHNYLEGVSNYSFSITTPGEFEIKNVYIEGISTYHDKKEGSERGKNTIFQISMENLNILHLGDLGHTLNKETLEKILDIDILLIPVGGFYTIDAEDASKVISEIEPGLVIPMHYREKEPTKVSEKMDPLKKFLDEMGVENVKTLDKLKVTKADIPEETEIIVLDPTH